MNSAFQVFTLTAEQELQGSVFNKFQLMRLQNEKARIAEELIRLKFDPTNPQDFIQQQAYKTGQLELLDFLILSSEDAEVKLVKPQQSN